ncbi:type I restriction endonuclease subunit R [Geobacter sulfurreducens subsp. ethanolicus]|uniref:type I restriction endonuclease subunit R n=1 Tax=Geobacter sulfurreducens TaxID=35554 RepID=UPI002573A06E|nr:type I restriction endonuclease subunit R [Geobacter sulfurreducens]BEH09893.1 type I restriction endonuclease subunit R [Geobacter sulfurreducens subsp. ethanolicus]
MAGHRGTETTFELTTIERLEQQGYTHLLGLELERPHDEVVLKDLLRANLAKRYKELSASALDEAVSRISRPDGVDTIRRNKAFHLLLTRGFEQKVEHPDGREEHIHIHPIAWDNPTGNDFLVVNQLPIHGNNDRRPDIIIYVNGLPLVVFELKNPYAIKPTVDDALNQIQHYVHDISQLFDYNAFVVVSDGVNTQHGMWSADAEWYAPWKSINGVDIEPTTIGSMKVLVEGLFPKDRLLQYVRDFVLFEEANDKITKKGAKYHQFFAVRLAAEKTVATVKSGDDKRIGVIWHTTGSGKSLSMAFLVGILRRIPELENPSFVIQVDRNDLDDQLHDQFVVARSLVGDVQHADSVNDLRDLLKTEGGEVIFTTIEKFRLKKDAGEVEHPVLSTRSNVIIIADEAHRSQYGFVDGYARYLAEALPNARRIGFTGTPISFSGADTTDVFGDLIHTYDIRQSQEDKATVPIYYAPRQVKLHLSQADIDAALKELAEDANATDLERRKSRWAALAAAAGAKERMEELAKDLLEHFLDRTATLAGKAMAVCMTRENCVRLYDELTKFPDCPEVKIVMTGNLSDDPPEWNQAGHLTTKGQRDTIKKRMVDPDDPLKIVIVCDMWLTGTDIPCLHTLYVDKPMQGHTMIQAISRVNRVFSDKPHGLIVDYIGIGDELRAATATYSKGGGRGNPAPGIDETAKPLFFECLEAVRGILPEGQNYGGWRRMSHIDMEDMYSLVYGALTDDDERCEKFLQAELRLTSAFLLVKHLDDCRRFADEVIFCQRVRKQLKKLTPGGKKKGHELDKAVRDLVDDTVESEGVVDIFAAAGLQKADISIIDDRFLMTFKDRPHEDLRLKLLNKLLDDAIRQHQRRNIAKAKSFRKMLEETLQRYHNRLIDAAAVVKTMVDIKKEMDADQERANALNLDDEELAFYDAVAENYASIYDQQFLCDLIHDVVLTIKKNLKVDWTEPHREDVKAAVRAAVKRVLRRRGVKEEDFEPFMIRIMQQAEALYADNYFLLMATESVQG